MTELKKERDALLEQKENLLRTIDELKRENESLKKINYGTIHCNIFGGLKPSKR